MAKQEGIRVTGTGQLEVDLFRWRGSAGSCGLASSGPEVAWVRAPLKPALVEEALHKARLAEQLANSRLLCQNKEERSFYVCAAFPLAHSFHGNSFDTGHGALDPGVAVHAALPSGGQG